MAERNRKRQFRARAAGPRAAAAKVLQQVLIHGRSLNDTLTTGLAELAVQDRAMSQALVYGVLRWYSRLDAIAGKLLQKAPREKDSDVHLLLLVGLYELWDMRTPEHAAVAETAGAARELRKDWAVALLNAVLRRFVRESDRLLKATATPSAVAQAHPEWLVQRLRDAWPDHWEQVLAANNRHAPMTLRVNRRKTSRDDYLQRLEATGIAAHAHPLAEDGLVLEQPVAVTRLPEFAEGAVSVQDAAAQLAAPLLDVPAGARVLDACAAPGGKACHILERQPGLGQLIAVEVDAQRAGRIRENLTRLELGAEVIVADAAEPAQWWDGRPFDRILLDAPCSGTGVIRRHPDIKWLRRPDDIAALAALQRRLLDQLWSMLTVGGKLVYATCSVLPEENELLISEFLAAHPDARSTEIPYREWGGVVLEHGIQLLPGGHDFDGFYYACLTRG